MYGGRVVGRHHRVAPQRFAGVDGLDRHSAQVVVQFLLVYQARGHSLVHGLLVHGECVAGDDGVWLNVLQGDDDAVGWRVEDAACYQEHAEGGDEEDQSDEEG